jgi:uncharacterized membrane protein
MSMRKSSFFAGPLVPTIVFTLVIAQILYDRGLIGDTVVGALVIYTIGNSLILLLLFGLPYFNLDFED